MSETRPFMFDAYDGDAERRAAGRARAAMERAEAEAEAERTKGEALMCSATMFDDGTMLVKVDLPVNEPVKRVQVWDINTGYDALFDPPEPLQPKRDFNECRHGNFDIYRRCGHCGTMVREDRMAETIAATRGEGREC